jgi:hypothetical protein
VSRSARNRNTPEYEPEPLEQMERIESDRRPQKCYRCSNSVVGKILFGKPMFSDELELKIQKGEIVIGGCCLGTDDPVWQCKECGQMYWRKTSAPSDSI